MRRSVPAIAALSLGLTVSLTGCFANPLEQLTSGLVENGIEQIIEGQTGVDINVDAGGGASLPDSWPADVPLPDGTLQYAAAAGGTFTAAFEVSDSGVADRLTSELEGSGYAITQEADYGGLKSTMLENDAYSVTIIYITGDEGNPDSLQYSIIEKTE